MDPRRLTTVAVALCPTVVLAGWVVASLAGFGSADIENSGAAPVVDRRAPAVAADAEPTHALTETRLSSAAVDGAGVAGSAELATTSATDTAKIPDEPRSIIETPVTDSSQTRRETPPVQVATVNPADLLPSDVGAVTAIDIPEQCQAVDACVDGYLWTLYQRTPKEDSIKVEERRKVTVKKRGKTITVTRSFTNLVDEDFTWKDPKAAEKAGMPMADYVIGGMDRSFKLKLFQTLRAAEQAGLSPGITSAFRDDYRQSLASGLKAATNRSYHGGSLRGGYGHGLAADIVSIKGGTRDERWASSDALWKWVDAHGKEFGIGRPYLDRDPPHVAPIDGQEYAAHHRGTKVQHAAADKKRNRQAARDSAAKHPKTARSSKVRTI